jgi:hypothetical protein
METLSCLILKRRILKMQRSIKPTISLFVGARDDHRCSRANNEYNTKTRPRVVLIEAKVCRLAQHFLKACFKRLISAAWQK